MRYIFSLGMLAATLVVACSPTLPAPTVAAVQATLAPNAPNAAHIAPDKPTLGGAHQVGNYSVWLSSTPAQPIRGQNLLELLVADANGQPITDANVSFDLDMTTMSHGKNVVAAKSIGGGKYSGTVVFMMPGPWRVIATIERNAQAGNTRFDFTVNLR